MKIGFIGTGIMGFPMASHLIRAGHEVRVFNRTASKALPLEAIGGEIVNTAAEAAVNAELVISMVSRTQDVREVLLGKQGAATGAPKGCLFVDMSTIDSAETVRISEELRHQGIRFVDAPVSGGETGAQKATLTIFCGGDASDVEMVEPVFSLLGKKISHMGSQGAGQSAKACNQILVCGALLGVSEALAQGKAQGLDLLQLIEATSGGAAQSWQLENLGPLMASNDFSPGFTIDLLHKDLSMILAASGSAECASVDAGSELDAVSDSELDSQKAVTRQVFERLARLQAAGDGALGTQAIYKTYLDNPDQ